MASFPLLEAELIVAAQRRAGRQDQALQEEVSWDLNLKSSAQRLAPYTFEFDDSDGGNIVIEQRNEKRNEPGSPTSGTGSVATICECLKYSSSHSVCCARSALWSAGESLSKLVVYV
jgi:hypothetical protein